MCRVQVLNEAHRNGWARCRARGYLGQAHFSRTLGFRRSAVNRSQLCPESLPFSEFREEIAFGYMHENRGGVLGVRDVFNYNLCKALRTVASTLQVYVLSACLLRLLDSGSAEELMESATQTCNSDLTLTQRTSHTEPAAAGRKLTIGILGSSVARGFCASSCLGWSAMLKDALQNQFGYSTVNMSVAGADVETTLQTFDRFVPRCKPDILIISLSLGNEGIFLCPPSQRKRVQMRFENGIRELIAKTVEIGARPVLGGVYPNGDSVPHTYELLQEQSP
eukprot:CAMPEP_0113957356 /NCGR_PEP_ID=MMETSP0011_2-20120614/2725_1 /TAXON_ID=101924 /ORGANISM="Rhodosorus marinus" /LENGTH=278 /DNA_ID=CAMNT_0000967911 /DNA_START=120 /DNA_END=956 /DNA_ORIENTATION=- /assembly_acc=CAM_ASM_000156